MRVLLLLALALPLAAQTITPSQPTVAAGGSVVLTISPASNVSVSGGGSLSCTTSCASTTYTAPTGVVAQHRCFSGDGGLISNSSSTGAVTTTLANAAAYSYWSNNTGSTGAPGYHTIPAAALPTTMAIPPYMSIGGNTYLPSDYMYQVTLPVIKHWQFWLCLRLRCQRKQPL